MDQPEPLGGTPSDLLDEALAEYMRRGDRGEVVDRERFLREYAAVADELRDYFRDCDELLPDDTPRIAALTRPHGDETLPRRFGDYELLETLGRGGMGVVYKARQVSLSRVVALKMIRAGTFASPDDVQRFRREAEASARLDHPNIAPLYEVGEHEGHPYFSMKLLEGGSLTRACGSGKDRREQRRGAGLLATVARAVHHAHQRGVLHRDLKPANILLDGDGRPHVVDFGLARWLDRPGGLTGSGTILGTPGYMAPEQVAGPPEAVTTAADVYGLGAVLYELLTGRPPFSGGGAMETLLQVKESEPARPRQVEPGVDRDLETVCLKCLAREPHRRYDSALAVAEDLERWLAGETIHARRAGAVERLWRWAKHRPTVALLTVALFLSLAVLVGYLAWSRQQLTRALADTEAARLREKEAAAAFQREAYRALVRETEALRLAHPVGWRNRTLQTLSKLARMDTPERDPLALRGEAVACLGEFDARVLCRWEVPGDRIAALEFSSDGLTLASAGMVHHLSLWEAATGRRLHQVTGAPPRAAVLLRNAKPWRPNVHFHPAGGSLLYSAGEQGLTSLAWPNREAKVPPPPGSGSAQSFAFDREGKLLAVGWGTSKMSVHDTATGEVRRELRLDALPQPSLPLAMHPRGEFVAVSDRSHQVKLVSLDPAEAPILLGKHTAPVRAFCFSPDGSLLASASDDNTIGLWEAGRPVASRPPERLRLHGHRSDVSGVAFSPDGSLLASVSGDMTLRLWHMPSGTPLMTIDPGVGQLRAVAFDPSGTRLAVASGSVVVYELVGREQPLRLSRESGSASLAFHPREPVLLAGGTRVARWDLRGDRPGPWPWKQGKAASLGSFHPLVFRPDGKVLAGYHPLASSLSRNQGGGVSVVSLIDWETGDLLSSLRGGQHPIRSLAYDPAGTRLATGDGGGWVAVWDSGAAQPRYRRQLGKAAVEAVAFPGEGLIVGLADGTIVSLDGTTGQEVARARVAGELSELAVSPDRGRLAVTGRDGALHVLTLPDLQPHSLHPSAHEGGVHDVAFSPDGRYLASAGADRRVMLWDAARLVPLCPLPTADGVSLHLAFSADGRRLAAAGVSESVAVYDLSRVHAGLAELGLGWAVPDGP